MIGLPAHLRVRSLLLLLLLLLLALREHLLLQCIESRDVSVSARIARRVETARQRRRGTSEAT